MWTPSFVSVLSDLWRFFWRLDSNAKVSQKATSVGKLPPKENLITLDTTGETKVKLLPGNLYTAESVETLLIRKKLSEYEANLVQSGNLTLIEWLLYNLSLQSTSISLLALKMSPLGLWHQTLKGVIGVKVGIEPTTGALMEWFDDQKVSHIGVIERLSPANTITFRTLSYTPSGTCVEEVFTEQAWKELGPVFTHLHS